MKRQVQLVLWMILLLASTALVFWLGTRCFGAPVGYLGGFIFYWLVWCLAFPLAFSRKPLSSFFSRRRALFTARNWWVIVLLAATIVSPVFMYFLPGLGNTPGAVILLGVPLAFLHAFFEETLWRGLWVEQFGTSVLWSAVVPTILFALWHLSPQIAHAAARPWLLVLGTLPLGAVYAMVAMRTKSAFWSTVGHGLSGCFAFSGYLAVNVCAIFGLGGTP